MTPKKFNEVKPREQAGSLTAQQYEYQYCQTAKACFGLLESSENICVFCEWHDDFVTEYASTAVDIYGFSQVKTKSLAKGGWSFTEVFGVTKKSDLNKDCPFFRMAQNHFNFKSSCRKFSFITNTAIKSDVSSFLNSVSKSSKPSELDKEPKKQFDLLWEKYKPEMTGYKEDDFFDLIKIFKIEPEVGNLGEHTNILRGQVQDKVKQFCEIDLKGSNTNRITTNLLELIRKKSQKKIQIVPIEEDKLRSEKAIVVTDVLDLLPLSKEGLKALQKGDPDVRKNVIALSRLQQLCMKSKIPQNLIGQICNFKVDWDIWLLNKKHEFEEADFNSLKWACTKALAEENELSKLDGKAQDILNEFSTKLPTNIQLTKPLIMGFIFSLASQMEFADE